MSALESLSQKKNHRPFLLTAHTILRNGADCGMDPANAPTALCRAIPCLELVNDCLFAKNWGVEAHYHVAQCAIMIILTTKIII